jgi:serine protease Do
MKLAVESWLALLAGVAIVAFSSIQSQAAGPSGDDAGEHERRIEYIQKALKGEPSPFPGKMMVSAGTGFYVAPKAILTNRHVVEGCAGVTLRGVSGQTVVATIGALDKTQDLALVKAEKAPSRAVASFRPMTRYIAGDIVATIGYPDQGLPRIEPFLTRGLVLSPDRQDGRPSRFAIRADIRPGNSGGPVFNVQGVIVGIMNAKIDTVRVFQKTGRTVDNVGFAITTGPIFDFLAQQGVKPIISDSTAVTPEPDLLAKVRPFTVRLACWR